MLYNFLDISFQSLVGFMNNEVDSIWRILWNSGLDFSYPVIELRFGSFSFVIIESSDESIDETLDINCI